jgi:hypothetical protein
MVVFQSTRRKDGATLRRVASYFGRRRHDAVHITLSLTYNRSPLAEKQECTNRAEQ